MPLAIFLPSLFLISHIAWPLPSSFIVCIKLPPMLYIFISACSVKLENVISELFGALKGLGITLTESRFFVAIEESLIVNPLDKTHEIFPAVTTTFH